MKAAARVPDDVLDGALEWLARNVGTFRMPPVDGSAGEREANALARKAFAELSIACMILSRLPNVVGRAQVEVLVAHLRSTVCDAGFARGIARRADLFYAYLVIYATMAGHTTGLRHLRRQLEQHLAFRYSDAVDRSVWNSIDVRYHLDLAALPCRLPDLQALFARSVAWTVPAFPLMTPADAYAIAHILFFVGDFGRRSLAPILADRFAGMRERVACLLGLYVHKRNWDLTSELLTAYSCIEREARPIVRLAWNQMAAAQDASGFVPSPAYDPAGAEAAAAEPEEYRFRSNYHTTLVATIAAALWSSAG